MREIIQNINFERSEEEHKFTSTGIKFWRHKLQMESYREGSGKTIISTHISPEGTCNLRCDYCSVAKRKTNFRIPLENIKDYILKLKSRGLKAVILTGGGEPTLYPYFNELVKWIKFDQNLSIALITNGTLTNRVDQEIWDCFSWVRVSLNFVKDFDKKIKFPKIKGILGSSMVYTGQTLQQFNQISDFTMDADVKYIRVLPNCLLNQEELLKEHKMIIDLLEKVSDKRFFHQFKVHGAPCSEICHQAYFRPYLSEVNNGTVYPCDSLVLNDSCQHFADDYAICKSHEILDFMDGKIRMRFNASEKCKGCVFTDNIKLLDAWKYSGVNKFNEYKEGLIHEEFV